MLACKRFKGRHTGECIASTYSLRKSWITTTKVNTVVNYNASHMVVAFSNFEDDTSSEEEDTDDEVEEGL